MGGLACHDRLLDGGQRLAREKPPRMPAVQEEMLADAPDAHSRQTLPASRRAAAAEPAATPAESAVVARASASAPATARGRAAIADAGPITAAATRGRNTLTNQGEHKGDERDDDGGGHRSDEHPDQDAGNAARRNRAEQPPEQAAEHSGGDENAEDEEGIEQFLDIRCRPIILLRLGRRQRFAVDHLDNSIDARPDAAGEINALEFRHDELVDDALAGDIGQRAFEPIADLDAKLVVVLGDQQDRAVIDPLAPDLPGIRAADRILFDGLRVGCWD